MRANAELLNFIYENARMGVVTIRQLLEIVKEGDFHRQLASQLSEYETISSDAKAHMERHGIREEDVTPMQKLSSYLIINMKTLTDKSDSNIAEMMLIGSVRGIAAASRHLREYQNADEDIRSLMETLLKLEERNIESLKGFL